MRITALSFGLAAVVVAACTDQTPSPTALNEAVPAPVLDLNHEARNPLLGSWWAKSAVLGDNEILGGLQYFLTLRGDGTHSVSVSNDMEHLVCPATQTSCEWDGTYTYTATTITFDEPDHPDPGEAGEDTGLYALCGGKLIQMDYADDDAGIRVTYQRTGWGR